MVARLSWPAGFDKECLFERRASESAVWSVSDKSFCKSLSGLASNTILLCPLFSKKKPLAQSLTLYRGGNLSVTFLPANPSSCEIFSRARGKQGHFQVCHASKDDTLPCKCQALAWKNEPKAWIQGFQALNFFFGCIVFLLLYIS